MRMNPTGRNAYVLSPPAALLVCLVLALLMTVPGCSGCLQRDPLAERQRQEELERKKKKEKPKPDFSVGKLRIQPRDPTDNQSLVKAGHWMSASQPMKANNFDFQANLESASTNKAGVPFEVLNTNFRLRTSRPVVLPKGQTKYLDSTYFVPSLPSEDDGFQGSRIVWMQSTLRARRGGREVTGAMSPTTTMPDYQYFFVVLAQNPNRYTALRTLDSVRPPANDDEAMLQERIFHYRVVLPPIDNRVPLPSQPLAWTSIAYVLWDGLNPNVMTLAQQQAMVDWLHWGGQLIINGPDSLDQLRGSFLDPYLPARAEEAVSWPAAAFEPLNDNWALPDESKQPARLTIEDDKPVVGVKLALHEQARPLAGTGDMVIERRVGSGRVVTTAFSLADRRVVFWRCFDNFYNGCLLRRPHRSFGVTRQTQYPIVQWAEQPGLSFQQDARYVTQVRYFTRDAGAGSVPSQGLVSGSIQTDVAGWNDRSGAADVARQSLRDAAGISVPEAGFVFRVLAMYLLILAPLNWIFFRLIGRVEWAWLAAPLIAVAGAVAVVRLAQLDIGFARSRTEMAVLEAQEGYARGHLTRYTALYTSLSTGYDLYFDDDSAQAMPFPNQVPYQRRLHEDVTSVEFRRDKQISLSGFQVASNSTGLVHSEQMIDLGGAFRLLGDAEKGWMVKNESDIALQDAGVLVCPTEGKYQTAWIGPLDTGQSARLDLQDLEGKQPFCEPWAENPVCCSYERQAAGVLRLADVDENELLTPEELALQPEWLARFTEVDKSRDGQLSLREVYDWCVESRGGELTLGRLFELASEKIPPQPGEIRLVGWIDTDLPGLTIRPEASQKMIRLLVVVHLRHPDLPDARSDTNLSPKLETPESLD